MGLFVLIVCNYKSYVTCEHHMFTGKAKCIRVMKVFFLLLPSHYEYIIKQIKNLNFF